MEAALAAPASGLPSLLTALLSQVGFSAPLAPPSHFLMEAALAAPASGLPSLLTALASQLSPAGVGAGAVAVAATGATGADAGLAAGACANTALEANIEAIRKAEILVMSGSCKGGDQTWSGRCPAPTTLTAQPRLTAPPLLMAIDPCWSAPFETHRKPGHPTRLPFVRADARPRRVRAPPAFLYRSVCPRS